jgi:hypothetical protein
MSITRSGIVLALCVLSQTVYGAEVRRAPPSGRLRAATPRVAVAQGTGSARIQSTQLTAQGKRAPFPNPQSPEDVEFLKALQVMSPYMTWMIGANKTGLVYPKSSWSTGSMQRNYNLKNKVVRKFLQYENMGAGRGIELDWTDHASADMAIQQSQWFFSTPHGSGSVQPPIVYGEPIAMAWGSKSKFVRYSNQAVGVNLELSGSRSFEWVILGGRPGTTVKRGKDWIILFNLKNNQPLVHVDRNVGGGIGFAGELRAGDSQAALREYLRKLYRDSKTLMTPWTN